jgi:hypothetical protein
MPMSLEPKHESLLKRRITPLSISHDLSCFMSRIFGLNQIKPIKSSILHGFHVVRFPLIALTTRRAMGPARHVLSQMVVAGTMTVHPPYNPVQSISDKTAVNQHPNQ